MELRRGFFLAVVSLMALLQFIWYCGLDGKLIHQSLPLGSAHLREIAADIPETTINRTNNTNSFVNLQSATNTHPTTVINTNYDSKKVERVRSRDSQLELPTYESKYSGPSPDDKILMNMTLSVGASGALKMSIPPGEKDSLNFSLLQRRKADALQHHLSAEDLSYYNYKVDTKFVLFWNRFSSTTNFNFGDGKTQFIKHKCPVYNCFGTENRTLIPEDQFDAIFYSVAVSKNSFPPPKDRYKNGKRVFTLMEAPERLAGNKDQLDDMFHYALTYRHDSDSPAVYGSIVPIEEDVVSNEHELGHDFAAGKTKLAAWFVSNCNSIPSFRHLLANELSRKGVPADVFGKCGPFKCPRSNSSGCYKMLRRDYKFYFAFENSLCNHYVTEKFFNALRYDVVPVTYGLGHELTGAPKDSYIDVFDFPDVASLANYLLYLNSNDTAYNQYFRWKSKYVITKRFGQHHHFCKLCEDLHTGKVPDSKYSFKRMFEGQCIGVRKNKRLRNFLKMS